MEEENINLQKDERLKIALLVIGIVFFLSASAFIAFKYKIWDLENFKPGGKNAITTAIQNDGVQNTDRSEETVDEELSPGVCPDGYDGKFFTLNGKKIGVESDRVDWINANCKVSRSNSEQLQPQDLVLITPFEKDEEIGDVWVYCQSSGKGCPRNERHTGLDFISNKNLAPIRAVVPGKVMEIKLYTNTYPDLNNPQYQVNMEINYDSSYSVQYSFEPMTHDKADAEYQLSLIKAAQGVDVTQGGLIGNLLKKGENSHIHLDLFKDGEPICPEKYFSQTARNSILSIIHKKYPDRNMCY